MAEAIRTGKRLNPKLVVRVLLPCGGDVLLTVEADPATLSVSDREFITRLMDRIRDYQTGEQKQGGRSE